MATRATRILVTGTYVNPKTYVLTQEDGKTFQTIREGEPFRIGNQMREWHPVQEARKSGRGTILVCKKFGNRGDVIGEVVLVPNKKGLWALTSGAARNGVFHNYHEPENEIEKQLAAMGVSRCVIERVETIDLELEVGGQLCDHCVKKRGFNAITDGEFEYLTEPEYAPNDHPSQGHRGCIVSTYQIRVYGGTYAIYYSIGTYMNGAVHCNVQRVILTPAADEKVVVEQLKSI